MNPLLKTNDWSEYCETIVRLPSINGFRTETTQQDIDDFFASLGYAEAIFMPLHRFDDDCFEVRVWSYYPHEQFFKALGYANAEEIPFEFIDDALVVKDKLEQSAMQAGFGTASYWEPGIGDDIPF